jgi:hypothetical protein
MPLRCLTKTIGVLILSRKFVRDFCAYGFVSIG